MKTIKFKKDWIGYTEVRPVQTDGPRRMYLCTKEFHKAFPEFSCEDLINGFTAEIYNRPAKGRKRFLVRPAKDDYEFDYGCASAVINAAGERIGADNSILAYVKRHGLNVLWVKIIPN